MARKAIRAVMVDDNTEDLDVYPRYLSKAGVIQVAGHRYAGDPEQDVEEVCDSNPDLLLIDYELVRGTPSQNPSQSATPVYGSTLGAVLREKFPETPIVLITRGSLYDSAKFRRGLDLASATDSTIIKDDIQKDSSGVRAKLVNLVEGFRSLAGLKTRTWASLCRVLGATRQECRALAQVACGPGISAVEEWRVVSAGAWIRDVVLGYPGILYGPLWAATSLGISEDSFSTGSLKRHFAQAQYAGPFAPSGGRWWKDCLYSLALPVLEKAGLPPGRAVAFGQAWNETHRSKATLSRCVWSQTSPADCVCYVLKKPVKREYSLPYRPDNRPPTMEEARVSFRAIRESNEFDEKLVASDSRCLVAGIQAGAENG